LGRWSDWYPLTDDGLDDYAPEESGVYQIALADYVVNYPYGKSSIIYIGSAPFRTLKQRLRDHLLGHGSESVYQTSVKYRLVFCYMLPESPYDTEQNTIDAFVAEFGDLPQCNQK